MPSYIDDWVYDNGLIDTVAVADSFHICSAQPANFAGVAAVSLGNKAVTAVGPENHATSGRQIRVAAFTGGTVTADGTAGFYALLDAGTRLLAAGPLSATQAVTNGNTFSTTTDTIVQLKDAD